MRLQKMFTRKTWQNLLPKGSFARIIHKYHDEKVIVSFLGEDQTGCMSGMPGYHGQPLFCIPSEPRAAFLRTGAGDAMRVIYQLP